MGRNRGTDVFRPRSAEHPDDKSFPGPLRMWPLVREARPQVLLFDCGGIPGFEFTAQGRRAYVAHCDWFRRLCIIRQRSLER